MVTHQKLEIISKTKYPYPIWIVRNLKRLMLLINQYYYFKSVNLGNCFRMIALKQLSTLFAKPRVKLNGILLRYLILRRMITVVKSTSVLMQDERYQLNKLADGSISYDAWQKALYDRYRAK